MSRITSIGAVCAAVAAFALPAGATASFDRHFSVVSRDLRGHDTPNGFEFHTELLNPANPDNRVGKGNARCSFERGDRKAHCRVLFHLDGSIGGFGDLLLKGNIGHGDNTLSVVDGSGDFGGAVGKALIHDVAQPKNLIDIDLTR